MAPIPLHKNKEIIVLLHGLFRGDMSWLRRLDLFLQKSGYATLFVPYPVTQKPLQELITFVEDKIYPDIETHSKVHFVTQSFGALVARGLIHGRRPSNLGRVVMMAPPNGGSEIADLLKKYAVYRKLFGPAGVEVGTDQSGIAHLLGPVDYEVGILAGNRFIDPTFFWLLKGPHDGKVRVENTRLAGMRDHLVIPVAHEMFPLSKTVHHQILHFIQNGSFSRP